MKIEKVLITYQKYGDKKGADLILKAFEFANTAHKGQLRVSKEEYIQHPLNAAYTLAKMELDDTSIAAALLHDVIEDTNITSEELLKAFNKEILFLVISVSKLGKIKIKKELIFKKQKNHVNAFYNFSRQVNILRKMFIAMSKDIRVILIKLADRVHNMETLDALNEDKQYRIAKETLEIYAPIASRLGIGDLKSKLEDLSFKYIYPQKFEKLQNQLSKHFKIKENYLEKVKKEISNDLKLNNIKFKLSGRKKHVYSIWKKMEGRNFTINEIYDLIALRIIVNSISDCYKSLGIIHEKWRPLKGKIKDYIAVPKPNGYQSLHTTVFCLNGKMTEFQIRTQDMHKQAEYGIASLWFYKTKEYQDSAGLIENHHQIEWVSQLADWHNKIKNKKELADTIKMDFFQDRIFVFTPDGDIRDLPINSMPIDFAFAIHSDVGMQYAGAKINGKMASMDKVLKNEDVVEIITNKNAKPKTDWLNYTKTVHARQNIKHYLKESQESFGF